MKKKVFILIILLLNSCGFDPIFNKNENNFYINKLIISTNDQVSYKIKNNLKRYSKSGGATNSYNVELKTNKKVFTTSKDKRGNPKTFELTLKVTLLITRNKLEYKKIFNESFSYKNNDNKFDLKNYENEITSNLTERIIFQINNYLLTLNQ